MKAQRPGWIMKSASGALVAPTFSATRSDVIIKLAAIYSAYWPWKRLYRNGARIVRVIVKEI